jgi:anti-sigma28 factor (negative regulator of flagellin synthesis)
MEIGPVSNRPTGQKAEGAGSSQQDAARSRSTQTRSIEDRAEISTEGRSRLAELADRERIREQQEPEPVAPDNLTNEERLEIIRKRVASGYYSDPKVKARIVDKLIDGLDK